MIISSDNQVAAVDPAEPDKVLAAIKAESEAASSELKLTHVLTTHRHLDHAGGNDVLAEMMPSLTIVGGKGDNVASANKEVVDGDTLQVGASSVRVLSTPCHTRGHVLYLVDDKILFTGDTLFVNGCGRFFEGSAEEMLAAMDKIAALPEDTLIYCGHEYTVNNNRFAVTVEPKNEQLLAAAAEAIKLREQNKPTVPSTVGREKAMNPFMRTREPAVKQYAKVEDAVAVMGMLRSSKNNFGLGAGKV